MRRVCAIEDKTAVVGVASYCSVSRNSVRFKALETTHGSVFNKSSHNSNYVWLNALITFCLNFQ